jgi:hypothetical protein
MTANVTSNPDRSQCRRPNARSVPLRKTARPGPDSPPVFAGSCVTPKGANLCGRDFTFAPMRHGHIAHKGASRDTVFASSVISFGTPRAQAITRPRLGSVGCAAVGRRHTDLLTSTRGFMYMQSRANLAGTSGPHRSGHLIIARYLSGVTNGAAL